MNRPSLTRRAVAVAGASAIVTAGYLALGAGDHSADATHPANSIATAPVIQTDLSSRQQVAGTLGYRPITTLVAQQAASALTHLPATGAVVARGGTLYELDGQSVRLLYGVHAAWRTLELGIGDGVDVTQLKRNLVALGYASPTELAINDDFDYATAAAIERWQTAQGAPATGVLSLGAIAFLAGAVRISAPLAQVGAPVNPGTPILDLSSPNLTVTIALDPTLRQLVHRGDRVSIQLPAGNQTAGWVSYVAPDASASSPSPQAQSTQGTSGQGSSGSSQSSTGAAQTTVAVSISLVHPRANRGLDQVPVAVEITDTVHRGVLAVPIGALLALAAGGYAVAIYNHETRTLVGVHTGVFDGGRVEVRGPGLQAGMQVEVPTS